MAKLPKREGQQDVAACMPGHRVLGGDVHRYLPCVRHLQAGRFSRGLTGPIRPIFCLFIPSPSPSNAPSIHPVRSQIASPFGVSVDGKCQHPCVRLSPVCRSASPRAWPGLAPADLEGRRRIPCQTVPGDREVISLRGAFLDFIIGPGGGWISPVFPRQTVTFPQDGLS